MASSSSSSSLLNSLYGHGFELANLLYEAKFQKGSIQRSILSRNKTDISLSFPENFPASVRDRVTAILDDLKGGLGSISRDSITRVVELIEGLVQKFVQVDKANAGTYENLAKEVEDFQYLMMLQQASNVVGSLASQHNSAAEDLDDENAFLVKYESLSYDEKRCLFYFSLFPDGAEIKKRELIFMCIAMTSLAWHLDGGKEEGEKVLSTLVSNGFIHRVTPNKYTMQSAAIRSEVMKRAATAEPPLRHFQTSDNENTSFILHYVGDELTSTSTSTSTSIEAFLNNGTDTLNAITLAPLLNSRDAVMIHLGIKFQEADYIVVQDISSLNEALEHHKQVRFLSLGGISGIVQLPNSVSKLINLVVLDLRACNSLESLPDNIGSLTQLVCLDLSECYLLGHIPGEISLLTKLRVLKGFIINPDDQQVNVNSCAFSDLSEMKQLNKLTIRTRRMNFPTAQDVVTLCTMEELHTLRIAWVGQSRTDAQIISTNSSAFPCKVQKLELQAVPERTASELLRIISSNGQEHNSVEKLYIRGALATKLDLVKYTFPRIKQIRLRYLPQLGTHWDLFRSSFPMLARLHIHECRNLTTFQCDNNGMWERNLGE